MVGTRAASRYAKAMLDISKEKGNSDTINNDMIYVSQAIAETEDLKVFLVNPVISDVVKYNALLEVFASVDPVTKELFKLLRENSRFEILGTIASEFQVQYEEFKGIVKVVVTTAITMDALMEQKVKAKVNELEPGKEVVIKNVVDESILGGFILKIGGKQFNASIANQLQVLKRTLTN